MGKQLEDFVGFEFNGKHSSEMGIKRVSDGSRYSEDALPAFQDKTVQVPGGDGTYYFGSYYTQRTFPISFAFDELTEQQFKNLRDWLGDREIHELVFDERPYKVYMAKTQSTPNLKYICFESKDQRVYKGEGSINFVCYYPYAKAKYKYQDQYKNDDDNKDYPNKDEWVKSCNLAESSEEYDQIDGKNWATPTFVDGSSDEYQTLEEIGKTSKSITLYNNGDKETDIKLFFRFPWVGTGENKEYLKHPAVTIKLQYSDDPTSTIGIMTIKEIQRVTGSNDDCFVIDTKTNLIQGCTSPVVNNEDGKYLINSYILSGNTYNEYCDGIFFKIPKSNRNLTLTVTYDGNTPSNYTSIGVRRLEYDILYY